MAPSTRSRGRKILLLVVVLLFSGGVSFFAMSNASKLWSKPSTETKVVDDNDIPPAARFKLAEGKPYTLDGTADSLATFRIKTAAVQPAPAADPLRLPGSLVLDPNRLVRIHSRFQGEVKRIGPCVAGKPSGTADPGPERTLRFGDHVKKGDLLAVVWSRDIGEKKSELIDAISKLSLDRELLDRYQKADKGVVPERLIFEAHRNVEADVIALAKAERTLHSWGLTDDDIAVIKREAEELRKELNADTDNDVEAAWAEMEIRCPMDGMIVEKNCNVGDIVSPDQDLFKVANVDELMVMANVYEEDIPSLRRLPPSERKWKIEIKSQADRPPLLGTFEVIGSLIDPTQHTGAVMGWLPNPSGALAAGQFVTAIVDLPPNPDLVAVPTPALIEEGGLASVFVETSAGEHQFTRRQVAVTRRGQDMVFIRSEPNSAERAAGMESLKAGEHVVVSGGLLLHSELDNLRSSQGHQVR
jgi:cobalt-zinc-cadmium efflux system membrane fusion protein